MSISQFSHDIDWVQTCIFSEGERDEFQRVRLGSQNHAFHTLLGLGVFTQFDAHLHLWRRPALEHRPLFDQTSNHAHCIM